MDCDFYKMRVEAVQSASKRSRWVLAASTVASLAQIGAAWNLYLSWNRYFFLYHQSFPQSEIVKELQIGLLKGWVESTFVSIPLIGIRLSIADASIVGSFALTILACWFFYSMRRENHLIGQLLRDASFEKEYQKRAFVFHGICGTQMFATLSQSDVPFTDIEGHPDQFRALPGSRLMTRVLFFLPAFAIAFVVIFDFLSIFWLLPVFRGANTSLFQELTNHQTMWIEVMLRFLFGSTLVVVCAMFLKRADQFQKMALLACCKRRRNGAGERLKRKRFLALYNRITSCKVKVIFKAYGFRTYHGLEVALYHALGALPEPKFTHRFS